MLSQLSSSCCKHLYKYSNPHHLEWLKTIILEHELYIPTLTELNDPNDSKPKLAQLSEDKMVSFLHDSFLERNPGLEWKDSIREAVIIRHNVRRHGPERLMRSLATSYYSELDGFRVYSLTKRYDNLGLWAHYAANHSGYCLEFVNKGPLFEHAKDVVYGDAVEMDVTNPEHRTDYWFYRKRREWSNEEEIRLVLPRNKGSKAKINPDWLSRIILGKNMSESNEQQIRGWAKERSPGSTVVKAAYDPFTQELTLV